MTDFPVIYEQAEDGSWSVRAVDLPVYSVGDTREEAADSIREAIALYLEQGETPTRTAKSASSPSDARPAAARPATARDPTQETAVPADLDRRQRIVLAPRVLVDRRPWHAQQLGDLSGRHQRLVECDRRAHDP